MPTTKSIFFQPKVRDDEGVKNMFQTHEHFGFNDIELYILLQQNQVSQIVDLSQVFCKIDDDKQVEVDVVDEEEDEDEILVHHMVNDDTIDHEQEPLPLSHVYYSPHNMTTFNLGADKPSSYTF